MSEPFGETWQAGDEALLAAVAERQTRIRREYTQLLVELAELDTRTVHATKGYATLPDLLGDLLRVTRAEARRMLTHAHAVTPAHTMTGQQVDPSLPHTARAMRDGVLSPEHLDAIHKTITALPDTVTADDRATAEQAMVEAAHTLDPGMTARLGRQIRARLDQDGNPPPDEELRRPQRGLRLTTRRDGRLAFNGEVDAETAAVITSVLSPLAKPNPAGDDGPDPRTTAERNGDALAAVFHLATHTGDLPTERGERPNITVTMSLDALQQQATPAVLDGVGWIDARTARRIACDSNLIPAVLGTNSEPLDIGHKTRVIPTGIRRALALRDRGCAFPNCVAPARWCGGHHIRHWADGGETALHNLVLLCGFHHRLLHHSDWEVTITNGQPKFRPPAFIDHRRHPRRNPIHPRAA